MSFLICRPVIISSFRPPSQCLIPCVLPDPFDALESDPLNTHAPESSLWELATLRHHYSASVSGLAKIFGEVMSRQSYAMEDFLDHSYGTVRPPSLRAQNRDAKFVRFI